MCPHHRGGAKVVWVEHNRLPEIHSHALKKTGSLFISPFYLGVNDHTPVLAGETHCPGAVIMDWRQDFAGVSAPQPLLG